MFSCRYSFVLNVNQFISVGVHLCCHLVQCDAVDATVLPGRPMGPAHGGSPRPNKAIVDGSGHVSGWPGGGTKAPCSSAVLTTPGHLYVPFAKRRKCLSSPFQGGKHCHPYNSGGDSAYARTRQSVSVWCCFATENVGWVSHKPHTARLWDILLMPDAGNAFNILIFLKLYY